MNPELRQACERALHVLTADGEILQGERALIFVYDQLGWSVATAPFKVPPLSWAAAAGYRMVARNRSLFARFLFRGPPRD